MCNTMRITCCFFFFLRHVHKLWVTPAGLVLLRSVVHRFQRKEVFLPHLFMQCGMLLVWSFFFFSAQNCMFKMVVVMLNIYRHNPLADAYMHIIHMCSVAAGRHKIMHTHMFCTFIVTFHSLTLFLYWTNDISYLLTPTLTLNLTLAECFLHFALFFWNLNVQKYKCTPTL